MSAGPELGRGFRPGAVRAAIGLLLIVSLDACAPRLQPLGAYTAEPQLFGHRFLAPDGTELPVRIWLPDGEIRAVILALHGFNDYSAAFIEPANSWRAHGIATYAYDQRGFGETPYRGLWPGTQALVNDAAAFARVLRHRHPGVPLYLLGDSMGAAVAAAALARDPSLPADGAILVAPAVWARDTMNPLQSGLLWLAAHTLPWATVTARGLDIRPSDNIGMLRALARDPLIIKETRIDALYGLADLMDEAMEEAPRIGKPILVLYGDHDEIIPREPVLEFLRRLPSGPQAAPRAAFYPSGFHMLLRDLQAGTVIADIGHWVTDNGAPLPSGADRTAVFALGGD